jgi:cysteine desulfurase
VAYLDHAATTPMLPQAVDRMTELLGQVGNASSVHATGRRARRVVEESRETIADALGARPSEVVFTSGGTEGDNLAIKGIFWARRSEDPTRRRVIVSAVEHHAVLDPAIWLAEHEDAELVVVPVDSDGRVDPRTLQAVIEQNPDDVAVVSVMWANNEVGTVEPITELAAVAAEYGIPLHTDGVQAVGALPVDFAACGASALTISGHKLGGPVGVGALVLGRELDCVPVLHGGGQERDVRSGTLDVPGLAAFAVAVEASVKEQADRSARLRELRDALVERVSTVVPDALLNGDASLSPAARLPGNAHFSFPGCEGDALLMLLDAQGVECSTGSACSAGVARPSHVLLAMGHDEDRAKSSLRFTLGHSSTERDIDELLAAIAPAVARSRSARRAAS